MNSHKKGELFTMPVVDQPDHFTEPSRFGDIYRKSEYAKLEDTLTNELFKKFSDRLDRTRDALGGGAALAMELEAKSAFEATELTTLMRPIDKSQLSPHMKLAIGIEEDDFVGADLREEITPMDPAETCFVRSKLERFHGLK
ncbi:hypothetical protein ADUPG1_009446 [Aduncisulcus paluster]|uniref:Uncharacterized protein n=1 Tax=Aduncisulcus paluster TaxID=2918883 RepID=A0ABQ5KWU7_9EUKA|nr:hypothetical protein ADUPG1_009446 [Aduncisulcus paluster]